MTLRKEASAQCIDLKALHWRPRIVAPHTELCQTLDLTLDTHMLLHGYFVVVFSLRFGPGGDLHQPVPDGVSPACPPLPGTLHPHTGHPGGLDQGGPAGHVAGGLPFTTGERTIHCKLDM